ncbi:hypothetical protein EDB81DRAFT_668394 [Dactylonectria macrodidyma]|uniref:DUF7704 domain-containing protein n=1 Tax=Dactylonectria macrodidyma TaxID=307937 RepID=A0A9P9DDJ4_9HYPO|nr:hypothetical protein EDB81DRAFT_668394 [Dactylonectria macrodidyma]
MTSEPVLNFPFAYRAVFLYFEPVGALVGALLLHFRPASFLNAMAPAAKYAPDNQIIYDQLAATYILFAFNEAIILRITNDLRVWRGILIGILVCDAIHIYGSWATLGGTVFWNPRTWRLEDWVNLVSLWGQAALRLAFVAGVGLKQSAATKNE